MTFRYREANTGQHALRRLAGADFLWLVLQHVLPKGFRRARNFGFLHANSKRLIALLQLVLKLAPTHFASSPRPPWRCPVCGAPMRVVRTRMRPALARARAAPPGPRREALAM